MSATNRGAVRRPLDAYHTPQSAIDPMIREISWFQGAKILEPCAGEGSIASRLVWFNCGEVATADIDETCTFGNGEDFLIAEYDGRWDFVVTNPPYSIDRQDTARMFVDKALSIANCTIMLLRINFLGAKKRREWWKGHKPTAIFVLSERPSFTNDGKTDGTEYAWFVWDSTGRQKVGWHWI